MKRPFGQMARDSCRKCGTSTFSISRPCARSRVRFWDLAQGREMEKVEVPHFRHESLAICPNGRFIAFGSRNNGRQQNALHVFDVQSKGMRSEFASMYDISLLQFSPNGAALTIVGNDTIYGEVIILCDDAIRIMEIISGQERRRIENP